MARNTLNTLSQMHHKAWRKEAKKLRRKRIRRKAAKERDRKIEEDNGKLLKIPVYQAWLRDKEILEKNREELEKREQEEQEELWMRRELLAQKKFREERKRQAAIEEAKEKERQKIQKEFEEQQRLVQERIAEKKRLAEEKQRKYELLLQKIDEFVQIGGVLPEELGESADTNPGKEMCPFFIKTASCRFGDKCARNHSRPGVSRILLLPHFFTHIRLEQPASSEYGSDLALEFSEAELYQSYEDFFEDVTGELMNYGTIVNFRTCKNREAHLRGNVFVEFQDERSSLRAYQQLQGRYYAGRRINVEFCKLISWKAAICGLSMSRTCPKGANCNYLHIFRNPGNKYNSRDPMTDRSTRRTDDSRNPSKYEASWNDESTSSRRNWRWSESPEHNVSDTKSYSRSSSKTRKSNGRRDKAKSPDHKSHRSRTESQRFGSEESRRSRTRHSDRKIIFDSKSKYYKSQRRSGSRTTSIDRSPGSRRSCKRSSSRSRKDYKSNRRSRSKSKETKKRKHHKRSKSKSK